jgi:hypothetical protein
MAKLSISLEDLSVLVSEKDDQKNDERKSERREDESWKDESHEDESWENESREEDSRVDESQEEESRDDECREDESRWSLENKSQEDKGRKNKRDKDFQNGREEIVLSYRHLTEEMQQSQHNFTNKKEQKRVLFKYITSKMELNEEQVELIRQDLEEKIHFFFLKVKKKYIESNRKFERFMSSNQSLLSKQFDLPQLPKPLTTRLPPNKSTGSPANILEYV